MQPLQQALDKSMFSDSLRCQLECHFLADTIGFDADKVDITHQVSALSAVDCSDIVKQLLTYCDVCISQLKCQVRSIIIRNNNNINNNGNQYPFFVPSRSKSWAL